LIVINNWIKKTARKKSISDWKGKHVCIHVPTALVNRCVALSKLLDFLESPFVHLYGKRGNNNNCNNIMKSKIATGHASVPPFMLALFIIHYIVLSTSARLGHSTEENKHKYLSACSLPKKIREQDDRWANLLRGK
jgi:hypothetical protein